MGASFLPWGEDSVQTAFTERNRLALKTACLRAWFFAKAGGRNLIAKRQERKKNSYEPDTGLGISLPPRAQARGPSSGG